MITLTLIYADGTRFIVGGFHALDDAEAWVATEKTRPYWVETTQIEFMENGRIR